MDNEVKNRETRLSDYIYILYKWKFFLIINLVIITGIGFAIAFMIPPKYRASSTVMIPAENMGFGGLAGLMGSRSASTAIGAKLFGISSSSEDFLLGLLHSRIMIEKVIKNFNLEKYYESKNLDETIRAFTGDLSFESNEYGFIEISVTNKNRKECAEIANYFVKILDSLNIRFNVEQAKNNRLFVEKRYSKNLLDLKLAEDSLYNFQKKFGIIAVPEQLEVSIKAAAEIESKLVQAELMSHLIKFNFSENSPQFRMIEEEKKILYEKVSQLKKDSEIIQKSNVFFPFQNMPDVSINYMRYKREIEIQQAILEVVMPLYEQAKVEEQKSIPTIITVDEAVPPALKDSPKRVFIIISFFLIGLCFLIPFTYIGEKVTTRTLFSNPLEKKVVNILSRLKNLYNVTN